ncbi:NPCBM/NEW2 domain-containing protein [Streptomyces sp. F63]|uniref:NPCBM/NEW2 domain-containing protein n=1 Tax=Streptomyces sp. F63 TaxID=2824887 RepID=UPI001B3609A4|nr:NPCBM/NEW2 domain-containing protein [Streptomyces sp. F63]MBQ0982962.1 NPCBM/NEW2 domain-containing protein [Streptomyces sp. F63]
MGSEQPTSGPGRGPGPGPADADLLRRTADGHDTAFEEFFRRHAVAVRRHARAWCHDTDRADDLTTEAFARTLREIRGGDRPEAPERMHLLVTVRRVAAEWARTGRHSRLRPGFADFAALAEATGPARAVHGTRPPGGTGAAGAPAGDVDSAAARQSAVSADGPGPAGPGSSGTEAAVWMRAMREAERSEVVRAFHALPLHRQTMLWHTLVEAEPTQSAARLLGLRPEAAAAEADRARRELELACLRVRLTEARAAGGDCPGSAPLVAAYAEDGPRARTARRLRRHLVACARCRAAVRDAADAGVRLRMALPVAVLGPCTDGYPRPAAGAVAPRRRRSGAEVDRGTAEGVGVLMRMGTAAGLAAATAVTLVGLAWDVGTPDTGPRAGRAPSPEASWEPVPSSRASRSPVREALPGPEAAPTQTRREETLSRTPSDPGPEASGSPAESVGPVDPGGGSSGAFSPGPPASAPGGPPSSPSAPVSGSPPPPSSAPAPGPTGPSAEPKPAPLAYDIGELAYDTHGDGTRPEVRSAGSSWLWPRQDLSVAGESFPAGVTVQARSSVTIDLNRACTAYDARVGLDDLRPVPGAARFSVYGDGALLWRSGVLRDGDAAAPVQVPLAGVRTIRLVVEPHQERHAQALADWAGARISCR